MKYNTLGEALTDLGWYHIDNFETDNKSAIDQINEIVELNSESEPKIVTDTKTVIVCDNHDFNETYLIDIVSTILKENDVKPGDYQLIYIDNVTARLYIDNPRYIQYHTNVTTEDIKKIEHEKLGAMLIVINPESDTIVATNEKQALQITEEAARYLLNYLDTDFAIKERNKK